MRWRRILNEYSNEKLDGRIYGKCRIFISHMQNDGNIGNVLYNKVTGSIYVKL